MFPRTEIEVLRCASELRQRYHSRAATVVRRQIGWCKGREAQHEVDFWSAVLERLNETAKAVSRIHVLDRDTARDTPSAPNAGRAIELTTAVRA